MRQATRVLKKTTDKHSPKSARANVSTFFGHLHTRVLQTVDALGNGVLRGFEDVGLSFVTDLFVCSIFPQLEKRLRDLQDSHDKEENALRVQINKLQQEKRQLQDTLAQYQTNEQKQKQEFDQVLYRAQEMQEMLERETQEKFASMAEQKSLRHQVENLSKNMKSLQVNT